MIELKVKEYQNSDKEKWDAFVMKHSINGTFLQTKNFLDYHKDRFQDASIILYKGDNTIVAVIPACTIVEGDRKIFQHTAEARLAALLLQKIFIILVMSKL